MENRGKIHLDRVKGRTSKEPYEIGEQCLIQGVVSKLWDKEAIVTGVRTAADKRIVSYTLDLNGVQTTHHCKFLRKIPNHLLIQ